MENNEKNILVADAARLILTEHSIQIEFGKRTKETSVQVIQSISIPPETALQLSGKLLVACVEYQERYRDLGIRVREDDE